MFNPEDYRVFALSLPGATEDFPFDEVTLVFRVGGKIFAFLPLDRHPFAVSLKCNPEKALELRAEHPSITGAFHLNKQHWNAIEAGPGVNEALLKELTLHSYNLIFNSLPLKTRQAIAP
jgi:predicted DNA-binding protein (MmcQ/YjbR family)